MTIRSSRSTERSRAEGRKTRHSANTEGAQSAIADAINALEDAGAPTADMRESAPGDVIDFRAAHRQRELLRRQLASGQEPATAEDIEIPQSFGLAAPARERRRTVRTDDHIKRYNARREREAKRQRRLEQRRAVCPACHRGLFILAGFLSALSILIVYSASQPLALASNQSANYYMIRQAMFVVLGGAAFIAVSRTDEEGRRKLVWALYAVALIGLIAIDFTPLGFTENEVRRWIKLPLLPPQQVSEIAKIALIGIMADFWSRAATTSRDKSWPWLVTGGLSLPIVGLVFIQPHFSAALLLFALPLFIAAYAGVSMRRIAAVLVPLGLLGIVTIGLCKVHAMPFLKTYQQERIAAHLKGGGGNAQTSQYQTYQSEKTIIDGGLFGRGPGQSLGKQGHLPEAHTDFIFAVIGEEWGMAGSLGLLLAYGVLVFFCFNIGHCAETQFDSLLCAGIGTLLAIQVVCNVGVATGALPVTGMPLPFMSYGGSGLMCTLVGLGLVLSVSRQTTRTAEAAALKAAEDEAREAALFDTAMTQAYYGYGTAGVPVQPIPVALLPNRSGNLVS